MVTCEHAQGTHYPILLGSISANDVYTIYMMKKTPWPFFIFTKKHCVLFPLLLFFETFYAQVRNDDPFSAQEVGIMVVRRRGDNFLEF